MWWLPLLGAQANKEFASIANKVTTAPSIYNPTNPYDRLPPVGVDPAFDCAWRKAAYEYAQKIQPSNPKLPLVYDALQLQKCGYVDDFVAPVRGRIYEIEASATALFVDSTAGADSNPGTIDKPLKTLDRAIKLSRSLQSPTTIALRAGTHRLTDTIILTEVDSGLTIQSYNGEQVWITGAKTLKTSWKPYNTSQGRKVWVVEQNQNAVYGQVPSEGVRLYGKTDTYQDCEKACQANSSCGVWTWHDSQQGVWALQCYFRIDGVYAPVAEGGHVSGYVTDNSRNVWSTELSGQNISSIRGLRVGGVRAQRARYPNANLELDLFPKGWISAKTQWGPNLHPPQPAANIEVGEPNRGFMQDEFQYFELGVRGVCDNFRPAEGYWCSNKTSGGGAFTYRIPSSMTVTRDLLPHLPYKTYTGSLVQAWRPAHWASWMFTVEKAAADQQSVTLSWSRGGFQDARGSDDGGEWFIENVFEELDAPNEFYYNETSQVLYYFYNATSGTAPPASLVFEATAVQDYFKIVGSPPTRGSERKPVVDVRLLGLSFRDAQDTYMEPHSMPSGGDWTLQRMAAVFFEDTENVLVDGCTFSRNDGIALMLSGYNRGAVIQNNEFVWNGDSAIGLWGYSDNMDGTSGEQPRGTKIVNNFCHELGHFEKQSSCIFQAVSAQTTIQHNIFFNGPRALININDGFGGGNVLEENLLFNSCRESADHGPFNSWDRQPYLTEVLDGTPNLIPAVNTIKRNLMVANYGADGGCVDNDDGSSFYDLIDNFFVFGGHKSDFNGHNKRSFGNINVYSSVYGPKCVGIYGLPRATPDGRWNEAYFNNTCVLANEGEAYISVSGNCSPNKNTFSLTVHDNKIYVPNQRGIVECGKKYSLSEWASTGIDPDTTFYDAPAAATIITWAKALLNF